MNYNDRTKRLPVTLKPEDNTLLIKLQAAIQIKEDRRLPISEVVRLAIRNLAAAHNIS